jgi:hypothetical protein
VARDDAPEGEELAGGALDAPSRRLEGGEQGDLELGLGAGDLGFFHVAHRSPGARGRHLHKLGQVGPRGAGADAEQAAIGERPMEGIDAVGEAALLAHLVP